MNPISWTRKLQKYIWGFYYEVKTEDKLKIMELYEEDIDQHISKKVSIPKNITNMVLFLCSDKNFIYL